VAGESAAPLVFIAQGVPVMLDAHVAARFGVTTREVNQAVVRNPRKFGRAHCFRLSRAETLALKSQAVISSGGHGGFKGDPMVYSMLGVARLATVLTSDEALSATDLILQTFLDVQAQVAAGHTTVAIRDPSRLVASDDGEEAATFSRRLRQAMAGLLDAVIDVKTGAKVGETAGAMTADALAHLRDRLMTRGLENDKLAAETVLILKQAELVEAQVRQSDATTRGIDLKNLQTSIDLVKQIMAMHRELQPPALITMLDRLGSAQAMPRLPDFKDPQEH
jgi:hypothetical protein